MKYLILFAILGIGFILTWFVCSYDESNIYENHEKKRITKKDE